MVFSVVGVELLRVFVSNECMFHIIGPWPIRVPAAATRETSPHQATRCATEGVHGSATALTTATTTITDATATHRSWANQTAVPAPNAYPRKKANTSGNGNILFLYTAVYFFLDGVLCVSRYNRAERRPIRVQGVPGRDHVRTLHKKVSEGMLESKPKWDMSDMPQIVSYILPRPIFLWRGRPIVRRRRR